MLSVAHPPGKVTNWSQSTHPYVSECFKLALFPRWILKTNYRNVPCAMLGYWHFNVIVRLKKKKKCHPRKTYLRLRREEVGKMSVKFTVKAWLVPSQFNRSKFQRHSQHENSFTVWQILTCGLHQGLSKHCGTISQPDYKSAIVLSEPYRHWQQETLIGNIWTDYEESLPTHRKMNIIQLQRDACAVWHVFCWWMRHHLIWQS